MFFSLADNSTVTFCTTHHDNAQRDDAPASVFRVDALLSSVNPMKGNDSSVLASGKCAFFVRFRLTRGRARQIACKTSKRTNDKN